MPRAVLIHWKPAEAAPQVEALRQAGVDVEVLAPNGGAGLRPYEAAPPDLFVIDLTRIPSQGRDVGAYLRQRKATRNVPLIFAGGEPEKVAKTRLLLPDATYTAWDGIAKAVAQAQRSKPTAARPASPGVMAGYSGTPLPRKLGIKANSVVALLGAPRAFARKLEPLPGGVRLTTRATAADRVLLFADSMATLAGRFTTAADGVKEGGGLWIVWPKKASGVVTDVTETLVRKFGLDAGWVDYKICAVDETWSGLLFARRKASAH